MAATQILKFTENRPSSPSAPFLLEDEDSVWLVKNGWLDVFLVRRFDGEAEGARFSLLKVDESQIALGLGHYLDEYAVLAVPSPGCRVLHFPVSELQDHLSGYHDIGATAALQNWINQLATAVSADWHVGPSILLEPGTTVEVPPPTMALLPRRGLVWVKHTQGGSFFRNAYFLNDPRIPVIDGSVYFPCTPTAWLQGAPGAEVRVIEDNEIWDADPDLTGLCCFHKIAMFFLEAKHKKQEERETELARNRVAAEASLVRSALIQLTAPIRKITRIADAEGSCNDPTFLACVAIGKKLRLKIKPHPDMLRRVHVADPLRAVARSSGIRIRSVVLKGQWWTTNLGPLLAYLDKDKTPVALLPKSGDRYEVYDPASKQTVAVTKEIAGTINAFAFVLYRPFPAKKLNIFDLIKFATPLCYFEIFLIIATGAAAGVLNTVMPAATGLIFDALIPGAERAQLAQMSVILVIVALTTAMFALVRNMVVLRLEGKLDAHIQAAVWDRLLSLPVSFFRDYSSGDLAQRSLGIAEIRRMLTGSTLNAIFSGIFSIFSFILLFYYSLVLALIAAALVLIAFLLTTACGILQVRLQRKIASIGGKISSLILQFVNGIAKFRVSGTENRAFAVWARAFAQKKLEATRARRVMTALKVFMACFPCLSLAIIFYFHQTLAALPQMGKITTGEFLAFFSSYVQFMSSVLLLGAAIVGAIAVIPAYERAKPVFAAIPEVRENAANPGNLAGAIDISHVSFRYQEDAPPVLQDVTIAIRPGQFVAIVGSSGSGKSTLLRILLGFEKPDSGAVYFDGQDLAGLDVQEVRRQMGVVLQSSRPTSGSIFQNIAGSTPLSVEDAWEAAKLAGIDEDIRRMPMGLHTYLSDGGGGISGGQRQRLMIARAIAPRPRIVLLDEATSALDNQTQTIVSHSMERLHATRVVIAHRLSTIIKADSIVVLEKGKIVQTGTYEQLIAQDGPFQLLARRQML